MFTMKVDLTTGIVDITVSGLWTVDEIGVFARALESAARQVAASGKSHLMLCDFTEVAIPPQEVAAALHRMAIASRGRARKCALYTKGVLARLQAKRLAQANDHLAVFADRDSARAWLLDDSQPKRPADHIYAALVQPIARHAISQPSIEAAA